MDKLLINELAVWAHIGVTAAEREVGQWLVATLAVEVDLSRAGQSDDLGDTLSYAEIAQTVARVAETTTCNLVEYLAERIITTIFEQFGGATAVQLQLVKRPPPLGIPMVSAGVEIVRTR